MQPSKRSWPAGWEPLLYTFLVSLCCALNLNVWSYGLRMRENMWLLSYIFWILTFCQTHYFKYFPNCGSFLFSYSTVDNNSGSTNRWVDNDGIWQKPSEILLSLTKEGNVSVVITWMAWGCKAKGNKPGTGRQMLLELTCEECRT